MTRILSFLLFSLVWLNAFSNNNEIDSSCGSWIKFIDFNAVKSSNVIHFTWTVEAESNGDHFTIEKSSNGIDWKVIVEAKSMSDHVLPHTYQISIINFADARNETFRLNRIDSNNQSKELGDAKIMYAALTDILVIPSVKRKYKELIVSYDSRVSSEGIIIVMSEESEIVFEKSITFDEGYNRFVLDISKLEKGRYQVTVKNIYQDKLSKVFSVSK